jgi:hypothetical protein
MNPNPSKKKSLPKLVQESQLYDQNPGRRMTLLVLALGTRNTATNEDGTPKWVQEDSPFTIEDMIGWCDFAQWRISLRVGKSKSQIQRDIMQFEKDGVISVRRWTDSNGIHHDMYQLNIPVIQKNQRPEQTENVQRPKRYKTPNSNRGRYGKNNQPAKATPEDFHAEAAGD